MLQKYLFLQYVAGPRLEENEWRRIKDLFSRISWSGDKDGLLFEENIASAKIMVCARCYENIVFLPFFRGRIAHLGSSHSLPNISRGPTRNQVNKQWWKHGLI